MQRKLLVAALLSAGTVISVPAFANAPSAGQIQNIPDFVPGVTDPASGDVYRYGNTCWEAKNNPGAWETPREGWFWTEVACSGTTPVVTPTPVITSTPVVTSTPIVTSTPTSVITPPPGDCVAEAWNANNFWRYNSAFGNGELVLVTHKGKTYQLTSTGGSHYEPGSSWGTWKEVSDCGGSNPTPTATPTEVPTATPSPTGTPTKTPTSTPVVSEVPGATLIVQPADPKCNAQPYSASVRYNTGDTVSFVNRSGQTEILECRQAVWCNSPGYEPGSIYQNSAWRKLDQCKAGITFTGKVDVASNFIQDSDTQNSNNPFVDNHSTVSRYQPIAQGDEVAGHVGTAADPRDVFVGRLLAGSAVQLVQTGSGNADLYLADSTGAVVDSSLGLNRAEEVIVPSTGDYRIIVEAAGEVTYQLVSGQAPSEVSAQTFSVTDDLVAGEMLVLDTREELVGAASTGVAAGPEIEVVEVSVPEALTFSNDEAYQLTLEQAQRLATIEAVIGRQAQGIEGVIFEPNYLYQAMAVTPNDPQYGELWGLPQIDAPQAWDITTGQSVSGQDVVVAVIDTGSVLHHPDHGAVVDGYDFISDADRARDGDGRDNNPDDVGDSATRPSWHGTHVAGTISARANNGQGITGVSWHAKIMPLRALGQGGGSLKDIADAIYYAAGIRQGNGPVPSRRADIINMSLGGGSDSQIYRQAVAAARERGVIVIAAAGNDGDFRKNYPGSTPGVVGVGATGRDQQRAYYSNYNSEVDVSAPGGNRRSDSMILSLVAQNDARRTPAYDYYQGTSMATPHVAGVVALMKAVNPDLTPAQFDQLLANGSIVDDLGAVGRDDQFGHGQINALKAVRAAQELAGPTNGLVLSTRDLSFDLNTDELTFSVEAVGDARVTAFSDNSNWVNVAPVNTDSKGQGEYRVTVDRSGLATGRYQAQVTLTDNNNQGYNLAVTLDVKQLSRAGGDVGQLTLEVVQSGRVVQSQQLDKAGNYEWRIDMPAGSYNVRVGGDNNGNNRLCDGGEYCGEWPGLAPLTNDAYMQLPLVIK
ncbi:S8 family peptidase [Salinibius halmophilus]|uniref:S8 family peptidase n=1 Tax=Salinibius halmophilus TaxID=1853216 RepID=UPI001314AB0A|nr:S8 family peptidase [Salinibius halmophilus]